MPWRRLRAPPCGNAETQRGTKSRRRILIGIGAVTTLVLVTLVIVVLTRPQPVINQATADQIQQGMTEAEVDAIIGAPQGNYNPGNYFTGREDVEFPLWAADAVKRKKWTGGQGVILVFFDNQGKVVGRFFFRVDWQRSPSNKNG
jgi:hypothetical protein